jgi:TatA/E family protein of Tat protein translocase
MLSVPHLIIVFVVALVVFGPEKLPELARNAGKFMAEFRRMSGEFKSTFDGHMRDLEREADERKNRPAATTALPADNTIGNNAVPVSADDAAAVGLPTLTAATGIVPSADPRIPPAEAPAAEIAVQAANDSAEVTVSSAGAGPAPAEDTASAAPEPVTDGKHYPD